MTICNNDKYKKIIRDYRNLIGEQSKLIKEQNDTIHKFKKELIYLKDTYKKYDTIINEVDRILNKFNF